nr:immunoglobulin light chain junction region [Macaca mulatta]MOX11546.1 immunoglobulin light chain junction region [Macaca mulatta]MOX12060.1 immunoglobulin light chain junction region [Macaca mulatta]MOX12163.1 immunoglobulin light chain junction region [Macaca mulatta]MOX12330.1 immunoglobulin light chain junction region [Macaca mulatta]
DYYCAIGHSSGPWVF